MDLMMKIEALLPQWFKEPSYALQKPISAQFHTQKK